MNDEEMLLEAMARAWHEAWRKVTIRDGKRDRTWESLPPATRDEAFEFARAALAIARPVIEREAKAEARDLAEVAWGIIANAGGGDWERETKEWRTAAVRWRDEYHRALLGMAKEPTDG